MEGRATLRSDLSAMAGLRGVVPYGPVPPNSMITPLYRPAAPPEFVPVDVIQQAKGCYRWVNDNIWDLNRMQKEPEEIIMEPGEHCTSPYERWNYWYYRGQRIEDDQMTLEGDCYGQPNQEG